MSQKLEQKTAIVTGGTRGIGLAILRRLLQEGANVAFCAKTERSVATTLNDLSSGDKAWGKVADVRSATAVEEFVSDAEGRFGKIDILVNNAGIGIFRAAADLSVEDWDQVIGTNLSGVFHFCRACLPRFRKAGGGQVVNISSLAGRNAFAGGSVYNASKFGLNGFTEALMLDYRQENVRVSLIAPGSVDTEFSSPSGSGGSDWKIRPDDVAEAVMAVLSMPERTLMSLVELRPSKPKKN